MSIEKTGFSNEAKEKAARERLKAACLSIVEDPELVKRDITGDGIDETFCNRAVRRVAEEMGCGDFGPNDSANRICGIVKSKWSLVSAKEAHEHASRGGLAIAAKKGSAHGHVAVVFPQYSLYNSGSWGPVPWVANVGVKNGVMGVSQAFRVSEPQPDYFIWGGE